MFTKSFNHVARGYRIAEYLSFGGALQRARCAQLEALPARGRLLVVGEGDGRFLFELLLARPHCDIEVVDKSSAMLRLARERTAGLNQRVRFIEADARKLAVESCGPYDAIVTLFFLDCFAGAPQTRVVATLASLAHERCRWLYVDFSNQTTGWRGRLHHLLIALLYRTFALLTDIEARTLSNPIPAIERYGFQITRGERFCAGLLRSIVFERPPRP